MALVKKRDRMLVRRGSDCQSVITDVPGLDSLFSDISHLGTGRFSDVALVRCRKSGERVALKLFPKTEVKYIDFIREYNYSYFLAPHQNITNTFEGLFATADVYYFVQEFCPTASLREAVYKSGGMAEDSVKIVLRQMVSALEFMHGEGLVHRNLRAKNVLIFDPVKYERVKITDFALTRRNEAYVKNIDNPNEYHAPELCDILVKEAVVVDTAVDIWAVGIIVYFSLIGKYPWQVARPECKPFNEWDNYIRRKAQSMPPKWGRFSDKGLKLFRKTLKTKVLDRITIKDLKKYITNDRWLKAQIGKSSSANTIRPAAGGTANRQQRQQQQQQHRAHAKLCEQRSTSREGNRPPLLMKKSSEGGPLLTPPLRPLDHTLSSPSRPLHSSCSERAPDTSATTPRQQQPVMPLGLGLMALPGLPPMGPGTPTNTSGTKTTHKKSKSAIHQFLSNTLATMSEISEQVVSATE